MTALDLLAVHDLCAAPEDFESEPLLPEELAEMYEMSERSYLRRTWIARRLRQDGYQARADHRRECVIVAGIAEETRRALVAQYAYARILHPY